MPRLTRFALLLALLLPLPACSGSPSAPGSALGEGGKDEAIVEAMSDAETAAVALGIARAVLYGEPQPDEGELGKLPGRRAFVCAYQERPTRLCATGAGKDLAESVRAAAQALDDLAGSKIDPDDKAAIRLKLDVVTSAEAKTFKRAWDKPSHKDVAQYGYWISTEGGSAFILPSEILERELYDTKKKGMSRSKVLKRLRKRNGALGEVSEEFPYEEFRTIAWVEKDEPGQSPPGVVRLLRTHSWEFADATPDVLLQSTVWAADYLMSSISADGKVRYRYRTASDRDSSSYNLLRHGGTTYSVLQAYDRTRYEPYLLASEAAMGYLFRHCDRDEREGPFLKRGDPDFGESMFIVSPADRKAPDGKVKLGGAGLALVMIDQYVEATGDVEKYRDEAQALARFLAVSQKEDGEFIYFPPRHPGGPNTDTDGSAYYPGEAILGLIRLYSWDRNELWKDTAVRAADWLIDVRDKGKGASSLANDHWLMLALSYLYKYTEDPRYLDHSIALCRAVEHQYLKNEKFWEDAPDYKGGYYRPPRSTPAATRGEGLGAVLDTCRLAGEDCDWIEDLLVDTVRHEMLSQYTPDMTFWMKNRPKSFGGWNGGLLDMDIRNDFVQHNMSAVIGLERHLRYAQEQTLPGGPGWTEQILAGTVQWSGVPAAELEPLRAASLRYRGQTRWEEMAAAAQPEPEPEPQPTE
jgi:hypothetical protein